MVAPLALTGYYTFFAVAFRHFIQIFIRFDVPLITCLIVRRFG